MGLTRSTLKDRRETGFSATEDIGNLRRHVQLFRLQTETALTILFQNAQRAEAKQVLPGPAGERAAPLATAYSQADFDDRHEVTTPPEKLHDFLLIRAHNANTIIGRRARAP